MPCVQRPRALSHVSTHGAMCAGCRVCMHPCTDCHTSAVSRVQNVYTQCHTCAHTVSHVQTAVYTHACTATHEHGSVCCHVIMYLYAQLTCACAVPCAPSQVHELSHGCPSHVHMWSHMHASPVHPSPVHTQHPSVPPLHTCRVPRGPPWP